MHGDPSSACESGVSLCSLSSLNCIGTTVTISTESTNFNGCLYEVDDTWNITWPNTLLNHISIQPCPNRKDHVIGKYSIQ